jgi:hypothetical protein
MGANLRNLNNPTIARIENLEQRLARLEAEISAERVAASIGEAFREQRRLFLIGWAILLASNIALWFRK